MKRTLKGWLVDHYLTTDNKNDKLLMLESAGNLTLDNVIDLMLKEYTGFHRETLVHGVSLFLRVLGDLTLNGYSVNVGLFRAIPQFRGLIENARWDPKKNSIHINFIQGKDLREAIADTSIEILGEKGDTIYIIAGQDVVTRATNGTATAGRNYVLHGRMLKLAGDHPSVGVTLTNNASGQKFILTRDMIAINDPAQLMLLLPANMDNGDYTVTVTTQYSHSGPLLKAPRSAATVITVGNSPDDIGTLPTEPPNSGGGGYIDPNT